MCHTTSPSSLLTIDLDRAQVPPVHLGLLTRWRLKPPHGDHPCRVPLRPQPMRDASAFFAPEVTARESFTFHTRGLSPRRGARQMYPAYRLRS
jgi:hypothetical protein